MTEGADGVLAPDGTVPTAREGLVLRLRKATARSAALLPLLRKAATKSAAWAWSCVKRGPFWLGVVSLAAFLYVADYVYDILVDDSYAVLKEDDIGLAWTNGIARLGIRPIYPPQEDLRVGDIWVIISGTSDNVPVLSKAVRLETLDLRSEIFNGDRFRPIFSDTVKKDKDNEFRTLSRREVGPIVRQPANQKPSEDKAKNVEEEKQEKAKDEKAKAEQFIATSITAFPGFSINHVKRSSASWGIANMLFGGDRKAGEVEQVMVNEVETYGAPAWEALKRLTGWCFGDGKDICADDKIARQFLSLALPSQANVLEVKDCKYTSRIELIMISRVFMTREIDSQRWLVGSRGARLDLSAKPASKLPPATGTADPSPTATGSVPPLEDTDAASGRLSTFSSDKTQMGLKGVFQRPLVFGFRSVSIALDQRPPEPPDVEKPCPAPAKATLPNATSTGGKP